MNKEDIYNEQLKPLIEQISKICYQNDIPMFATFQDSPEGFRTTCLNTNKSFKDKILLMHRLDQSWTLDDFLSTTVEEARANGHDSLFLKAMGIPSRPLQNQQ